MVALSVPPQRLPVNLVRSGRKSAHAYPREIEFLEELPKTPSGKIQRFLLRNQEIARQREAAPRAAAAN